ncbi:MAG: GDSL-type esterase/lipase family protein [Rhodospirillales bacterium]
MKLRSLIGKVRGSALALLLLGAAAPAHLASVPLSRADLPWWRARLAEKAAELHRGPVDLVFYGDSITQDWELSGPAPWADFQTEWQRFYGGRHAVNLGFKGDATAHLLWRIENGEAAGIHPKAAVVLIGANNFGKLHWPAAETEAAIEKIVSELNARLPGTHVLLLGVLPSVRSAWVDQNTENLNRALAARYHDGHQAVFMDLSALFLKHGRVDPDKFLDVRLTPPEPPLHPNAVTQAAMAAAIEPVLSAWLGDRPRAP